ncbi:Ig-like domain repeat protein, partial [Streptomyces sp. WMMB 322]|uniref:Ig-like domain repeat protein n=1 Tax=Streptomyces sp. WMMB 322 TaxID=1286821 RepID=UPI00082383EA
LVSGAASTPHAYDTVSGSPFTVTATYTSDDGDYTGSSGVDSHVVNAAATSTAVAGAPDPSLVGQSVTFTATVSADSPGGGTPTGSVVFDFGDGNVSAAVPLVSGVASTPHAYDTVSGSPFTVTATYTSDDGDYTGSSGQDTHVVNPSATTTTIFDDLPDPSVVGQQVDFTVHVNAVAPGGGTPTGSVVLDFGDGNSSAAVPLSSGVATVSHTYNTTVGSPFTVTASYTPDDGDYTASAGSAGHTVNP